MANVTTQDGEGRRNRDRGAPPLRGDRGEGLVVLPPGADDVDRLLRRRHHLRFGGDRIRAGRARGGPEGGRPRPRLRGADRPPRPRGGGDRARPRLRARASTRSSPPKQVGPNGRVIGVDMTPEMLERARATAAKARGRERRVPPGAARGAAGRERDGRRRHQQLRDQPGARQGRGVRGDLARPQAGRARGRVRHRARAGAARGGGEGRLRLVRLRGRRLRPSRVPRP